MLITPPRHPRPIVPGPLTRRAVAHLCGADLDVLGEIDGNSEPPVLADPFTFSPEAEPHGLGCSRGWLDMERRAGQDAWARDMNTMRARPKLHVAPREMVATLALSRALAEIPSTHILRPGAIGFLNIPVSLNGVARHVMLKAIVPALRHGVDDGSRGTKMKATTLFVPSPRGADINYDMRRFKSDLEDALEREDPLIVLGENHDILPDACRAMMCWEVSVGRPSQELILESLRASHSATGWIDTEALDRDLPDDTALGALSYDEVIVAHRESMSLRVARALQRMCTYKKSDQVHTLADLQGQHRAIEVLAPVARDLQAMAAGDHITDVPRGALLHGSQGTGKTMAAACLAGSAGVPLIATSYSSWQAGGHLGDCLKNMRSDFANARELGVCVLLIDEIDAVRARSKRDDHGASYNGAVLNGMLEEIGKLASAPGVFLLGASNHPDLLDPALVRSGRFDAKIPFSMPDVTAHEAILRGALGKALFATDLKPLAAQLSGQPGSDGPAAVRDARSKARADGRELTESDLQAALNRIAPVPDPALDWRMAVHEAGHVMCAIYLGHPVPERVVIGRNSHVRWRQSRTSTLETLTDQITIDLAGHTAEALLLSEASTGSGGGAGCDLDLATRRALRLEVSFGWGVSGMIWFDVDDPMIAQRCLADRAVRAAVEKRLSVAKKRATDILEPELDAIRTLARQLLSSRELSGQALLDAIVTARAAFSGTAETDKVVSFRRQIP